MIRLTALMGIAAALVLAIAPAAPAKGPEVRVAGKCTKASTSKLKVKADNGRLEAEFEVDSNVVGQRWTWGLAQNGSAAASGAGVTVAPSGSFGVKRLLPNRAGADKIAFLAHNSATGEWCGASATL